MSDNKPFQPEHIGRILFILLFAVVDYFLRMLILGVALFQYAFVLVAGQKNPYLAQLGASLSTFGYQVMQYMTHTSDEKPFPFSQWPS